MEERPVDEKCAGIELQTSDPLLGLKEKHGSVEITGQPADDNKRQLLSMMTCMTLMFFLTFIGYVAMESTQSSINPEGGLGATAVAMATFLIGLFSAFGSTIVQTLSPKWTMFLGCVGVVAFVAVNFYPTYIMLYIGSVAVGVTNGPFFVAQAVYLAYICDRYSALTGADFALTLSIFNGVFQFVMGLSRPIAFIVLAFVLRGVTHHTRNDGSSSNYTDIAESIDLRILPAYTNMTRMDHISSNYEDNEYFGYMLSDMSNNSTSSQLDLSLCGASHCPYMELHSQMLPQPDQTVVYILMSCYAVITIIGLLLCLFLRNVPGPNSISALREMQTMALVHKRDYMLLLVFSFMTIGMVESMEASSFYPSFVSCTLGLRRLSYVMITEGFTVAMLALLSGFMVTIVPRYIQMSSAFTINMAVGATWLIWQPRPDDVWVFFVLAIGQGCTVGIYRTQIQTLLTELSREKTGAAISIYSIYWYCTKGVVFAYSPFLCYAAKSYIYLSLVSLAFITYVMQEIKSGFLCKGSIR